MSTKNIFDEVSRFMANRLKRRDAMRYLFGGAVSTFAVRWFNEAFGQTATSSSGSGASAEGTLSTPSSRCG